MDFKLVDSHVRRASVRLANFTIVASFVAVVGLLVLYVVHFSRADFSSDDAVLNMLAESIAKQGSLFPRGWVSNNGDLMVPSGALILAPMLSWFSNGFALHAVAGVFAIALMLLSFAGFLKAARLPIPMILVATAVLATGPSRLSALMLFTQTTYVWLCAGFFVSATLIWRRFCSQQAGQKSSCASLIALASIVFLITFANPRRAVVMLVFPLYVFDRALVMSLARSVPGVRRLTGLFGLNDATVLLGFGFPFLIASISYFGLFHFGVVETVHNASRLYWDGFASLGKHARIFLQSWLPSLGSGSEIVATDGLLERFLGTIRLVFAVWLTWVGFAEVMRVRRNRDPLRTALVLAWLAALIPSLTIYIVYAPLAIDLSTMRYFTLPILMLLAVAAIRVSGAGQSWKKSAPLAGILTSFFLVAVSSVRFVPAVTNSNMRILETRSSYAIRLAELLAAEHLKWGYATWWNAGATTVLSGGATRVSPIYESGQDLLPFNYMTQRLWYEPASWVGETFLAFSRSETTVEKIASLALNLGQPSRTIKSDEFTVLVYDWNISSNFNCDQSAISYSATELDQIDGDIIAATLSKPSSEMPQTSALVRIRNRGTKPLGGIGEAPVSVEFQWLPGTASESRSPSQRIPLPCTVHPSETRSMRIQLSEPPAGAEGIRFSLSQYNFDRFRKLDGGVVELPFDVGLSPRIFQSDFGRPRLVE
ncbi:MAG: hypothetical protein ABIR27_10740 [Dokdonella sp.]